MQKAFGVGLAFGCGTLLALQSRINGALAGHIGSGIAAAVVSFGSGLVLLALAVLASASGRAGLARLGALLRKGDMRWWECVGGACGALLVASQGLTVGALGVATFTVALVAGQSVSSLLVDRAGLAPGGVRPVTVTRAAGAALGVGAVLVSVAGRLTSPSTVALAALPVIAGFTVAWQQAMNGRVRQGSGSVLGTTFVNFAVGTVALLAAFAVNVAVAGAPAGRLPGQIWLYAGGTLGIVFIAVAAAIVHRVGVLLLSLGMIAGQVSGAVGLDYLTPGAAGRPGALTLAGAALTLLAVGLAALRTR